MAKRALEAYRDLRRELDKNESPSFSIRDFNYFINSGIDEYVAKNYAEYPVLQKSLDDIRVLVKASVPLVFTGNEATLSGDYRHLLSLRVIATVNTVTKELYPERERSGMEGYNQNNAFHRASHKTPYYNIVGDKIRVKLGATTVVVSATYDYVKIPTTVYLNPDKTVNYNAVDVNGVYINNTTIEFPDHVYLEIIRETKRIMLENIESPRYQSSLQEQSMRP